MKKIVLFFVIVVSLSSTSAWAQQSPTPPNPYEWTNWKDAPFEKFGRLENSEKTRQCWIFQPPAIGSSVVTVFAQFVDTLGRVSISPLIVEVSTPPSNWLGEPFTNPAVEVVDVRGMKSYWYLIPIPVSITEVKYYAGYEQNPKVFEASDYRRKYTVNFN